MKNLIILLIIIAAGAVGYYVWKGSDTPPVFTTDEAGVIRGTFSIRDIMELDRSLSCNFRKNDEASSVVGSIIIFGAMVRGDFDIESEILEAPIASHFIIKEDTSYFWTSLVNMGYKSPVVEHSSTGDSPTEQSAIIGLEDEAEYLCYPWNADLTRFNLPSGVTFQEIE